MHPNNCVIEPFNVIYYVEGHFEEAQEYFSWVPYDLSTHEDGDCNIPLEKLPELLKQHIQLPAQFHLYNIPMIYYVK